MFRATTRRSLPRRSPPPTSAASSSPQPFPASRTPPPAVQPISFRAARQFGFTAATVVLAIGAGAWYTNQDTLERTSSSSSLFSSWSRSLSGAPGTGLQPSLARQRWEETYARASEWVARVPGNRLAIILAENWVEMSEAKRTSAGLIASFVGVWLAWRLPAKLGIGQWLAHQPLSGKAVTLFTSTFSHRVSRPPPPSNCTGPRR